VRQLKLPAVCSSFTKTHRCVVALVTFLLALVLQIGAFPSLICGRAVAQDGLPPPLGSLVTTGEVYVNDLPAPAESTIFTGDRLRTGEGVASFNASGKGALKITPHSSVIFGGTGQYVAELKSGTVVVSSFSGPSGLSLRAGDFVIVPAVQEQQTTAKVESLPDGSFPISCLEGSTSVVSLQAGSGLLLQSGESAVISSVGQLISGQATSGPAQATPESPGSRPAPPIKGTGSHKGWMILGLAGGGAAIIAAAAAASGGGHQAVSPSSP
jgi:hypothetical protein